MKPVERYVYPKSTRQNITGLRHYTVTGEAEATTIGYKPYLGQTQPKEKQESLDRWREMSWTREALEKITRDAAIRGTAMHKYLEDLILGDRSLDLTPLGQEAEKHGWDDRDRGLSRVDEVYEQRLCFFIQDCMQGAAI